MKISLRWLCDHIAHMPWQSVDIDVLVARFNAKVAEIEHVEHLSYSLDHFEAIRPQDAVKYGLSERSDLHTSVDLRAAFLICPEEAGWRWVTFRDVAFDKDGLIPALAIEESALAGGWKTAWESTDVILDVDNKSLTHRPDMWGHRGFAREVASLFSLHLISADTLLQPLAVVAAPAGSLALTAEGMSIENAAPSACSGIAGLAIPSVLNAACDVRATSRLINIGYRPRTALVDMTNYAMADFGHPLHAYDASTLTGSTLKVRFAQDGERQALLDGSAIALDAQDMVIVDGEKPISLAGIMGGRESAVSERTDAVVLEAACFHAATIRRSAARHKVRTESSQRFEKTLDAASVVPALARCAQLSYAWGVVAQPVSSSILAVLPPIMQRTVSLSHAYVVGRIGALITPAQVQSLLESIDFEVTILPGDADTQYRVSVPLHRVAKDISGQHDLVEEVARLYGFDAIDPQLPSFVHRASSLLSMTRERALKQHLAYSAGMQEQRNYGFYNETILQQLGWQGEEGLFLKNPVSQESRRLIATLVPHLLGNVMDNLADVERAAFFEWGTVWDALTGNERKELAGVWYDKRHEYDFYALKKEVQELCRLADLAVEWRKATKADGFQWLSRGALIVHQEKVIGALGFVDPVMVQKMGALPESRVAAFVLDASLLQNNPVLRYTVAPLRKYQHSSVDVSVMTPLSSEVAALEKVLLSAHVLIEDVVLIDFFQRKEWHDKRSVAFRLTLSHRDRTVTREEVEEARSAALAALSALGCVVRE